MPKLSYEKLIEEVIQIKRLADIAEEDAQCAYNANLQDNLMEIRRKVDYLLDCDWEV